MKIKAAILGLLSASAFAEIVERGFNPPRPETYHGCTINPVFDQKGFELLDAHTALPLIYNNGRASVPTEVIRNVEPFRLHRPPNTTPRGFYDLFLDHKGTKYYLAIFRNGEVGFTTRSSRGQHYITEGKAEFVTSVFSLNCKGHILAGILGGQQFEFVVRNHNYFAVKKTPSSKRDIQPEGFYVLPKKEPPGPPSTERCPNSDLRSVPINPGQPVGTNGCGTDSGPGYFVPELDFHECCNGHDVCYGTCSQTFDGCNNAFRTCNINQCNRDFADGTIKHWACLKAANVYGDAVAAHGQAPFDAATKEYCKCECKDQTKTKCNDKCVDLKTDTNNCGDCNFKCTTKKCTNGACAFNSCTGQTCETFGPCGPGGSCVCASIVDHSGFCVNGDTPCDGLADCGTSKDCPLGSVCAVGSCCQRNVCITTDQCGGFNSTRVWTQSQFSQNTFGRRPPSLF